jgi:hypothetical protein
MEHSDEVEQLRLKKLSHRTRKSAPMLLNVMHQRQSMSVASIETGNHYVWGGNCDGWHLAASPNLSVIQERAPSGSSEVCHLHNKAYPLFYVLNGFAVEPAGSVIHF